MIDDCRSVSGSKKHQRAKTGPKEVIDRNRFGLWRCNCLVPLAERCLWNFRRLLRSSPECCDWSGAEQCRIKWIRNPKFIGSKANGLHEDLVIHKCRFPFATMVASAHQIRVVVSGSRSWQCRLLDCRFRSRLSGYLNTQFLRTR